VKYIKTVPEDPECELRELISHVCLCAQFDVPDLIYMELLKNNTETAFARIGYFLPKTKPYRCFLKI